MTPSTEVAPPEAAPKNRNADPAPRTVRPAEEPQVVEEPPARKGGPGGLLRTRPWVRNLLIAGLVALLVGGFLAWRFLGGGESTDDAFVDGPIVAVAARVAGTVSAVRVEENQEVRAGQVLAEIDPGDYRLAVERARADLAAAEAAVAAARAQLPIASASSGAGVAAAEAQVRQARAGVASAAQAVEAARARLAQAETEARRAASDLERLRPLAAKDEISRQELDHAVAAEAAARAAVAEAREQVELAVSRRREAEAGVGQAEAGRTQAGSGPQRVEASRADLRIAEAKAEQMRTALALAESQLAKTVIRAPVDGVVGRRNVDPGEAVQAGQPVFALVPLSQVWVTANFKETQIARMRPGQPAVIHVDAYDRDFRGHVEGIGAATGSRFSLLPAENASGNFVKVVQRVPVRIVLEKGQDREHLLRPGLSVVPEVETR